MCEGKRCLADNLGKHQDVAILNESSEVSVAPGSNYFLASLSDHRGDGSFCHPLLRDLGLLLSPFN